MRAAEYQEGCGQTEETAPETSAGAAHLHDTQVIGIVECAGKSRNVKKFPLLCSMVGLINSCKYSWYTKLSAQSIHFNLAVDQVSSSWITLANIIRGTLERTNHDSH